MGPHSPLDLSRRINLNHAIFITFTYSFLAYLHDPFLGTYCSTLSDSIREYSENIWRVLISDRAGVSHTRWCTYTHSGSNIKTNVRMILFT